MRSFTTLRRYLGTPIDDQSATAIGWAFNVKIFKMIGNKNATKRRTGTICVLVWSKCRSQTNHFLLRWEGLLSTFGTHLTEQRCIWLQSTTFPCGYLLSIWAGLTYRHTKQNNGNLRSKQEAMKSQSMSKPIIGKQQVKQYQILISDCNTTKDSTMRNAWNFFTPESKQKAVSCNLQLTERVLWNRNWSNHSPRIWLIIPK